MRNNALEFSLGESAVYAAAGLEKKAARRETKILQEMFERWDPNMADFAKSLYSRGAAIGYAPRKFIRELGTGAEGVVDLTTNPTHGITVRKMHNPHAELVSEEMLDRKADFFQQMHAKDPNSVAQLLGRSRVGKVNPLHTFESEYVPGNSLEAMRAAGTLDEAKNLNDYIKFQNLAGSLTPAGVGGANPAGRSLKARLQAILPGNKKAPETYHPVDNYRGHGGNVIMTPDGPKVIDTLPLYKSEVANSVGILPARPGRAAEIYTARDIPTDPYHMRGNDIAPTQDVADRMFGTTPVGELNPRLQRMTGAQIKAWAHRGAMPRPPRPQPVANGPQPVQPVGAVTGPPIQPQPLSGAVTPPVIRPV